MAYPKECGDGRTRQIAWQVAEYLAEYAGPRQPSMYDRQAAHARLSASQYGGKKIIKYAPTQAEISAGITSEATLVDWSSPDGAPRSTTIEVGRTSSGGGGSFPSATDSGGTKLAYRARAQITVGTTAVTAEPFFVDVGRGQKFQVSASYVGVTLQMQAPPAGFNSGSLAVSAGLGLGTSPTFAPVVYTQYIDSLATGAANKTNIIIPPKCNFLWPVRSSDVNNTVQLDFKDAAGTVLDSLQFANGTMVFPAALEDAYSIDVTNLGTAAANYRLVFQVST